MFVLFTEYGRFSGYDGLSGIGLYESRSDSLNVQFRLTIAGDKNGFAVYVDGNEYSKKDNIWRSLPLGGVWILGNQQDVREGGFDSVDQFFGKICDLQMWDYKMTREQLDLLFYSEVEMRGNFLESPPSKENMFEFNGNRYWSN